MLSLFVSIWMGAFNDGSVFIFYFIECVFRKGKKMNADSVLQGIWTNGSDLQPEPPRPQEFVEHRRQFLSQMWVAYKTLLCCYNLWKQNPVLKGRFSFHYQNEFHNRSCKTEFCCPGAFLRLCFHRLPMNL